MKIIVVKGSDRTERDELSTGKMVGKYWIHYWFLMVFLKNDRKMVGFDRKVIGKLDRN